VKDDGRTPGEQRVDEEDVILDEGGEVVSTDDTVIARAFRVSMLVLLGAVVLGGLFYFFFARQTVQQGPELQVEAEAPEIVVHSEAGELPVVTFTDITAAAGIDFEHVNGATGDKLLPETMGSGAAFFDYDNDGDADLLLVNSSAWPFNDPIVPAPTAALYRNRGDGTFEDVTRAAGLDISLYGMGVAVGDIDADGWRDVFITAVGENRLLRNRGDGRFEDVTARAGVAGEASEWSAGAGFFDADNDGDLDLFVANYVRWSKEIDFQLDFRLAGVGRAYGPPQSYEGTYPYFYRNLGDGTFEDATDEVGMRVSNAATGVPEAKSLALGIADIDASIFNLYFFIFAFLISSGGFFFKKSRNEIIKTPPKTIGLILIMSIFFTIGIYLFMISMKAIDPATVSFLSRIEVVILIILAFFFLKERLNRYEIIGGLIAIAGVLLLKFNTNIETSKTASLMIVSAACFATAEIMVKKYIDRIGNIRFLFFRNLFTIILMALIVYFREVEFVVPERNILFYAFAASLMLPILGRLTFIEAIRRVNISRAVLITQSTPIFTILFAWAVLGLFMTRNEIFGGILIISGVLIVKLHREKPSDPRPRLQRQ